MLQLELTLLWPENLPGNLKILDPSSEHCMADHHFPYQFLPPHTEHTASEPGISTGSIHFGVTH
jgi:hypothetical protein